MTTSLIRVIPRLDVKGVNLVKGVHLEGLRVLGRPYDYAKAYYEGGADELLYMDSVASLFGRNNLQDIVRQTSENIFIPMTVGGGIRSVDDVKTLLNAGADKVAINTALFADPLLIKRVADSFGSQCVVASIDAVRSEEGYECLTDNGREKTGMDVFKWVDTVVEMGAGEILLTSVDREGTGKGYDLDLVSKISDSVPIPVIACGGAGNSSHVVDAVKRGGADAISMASILHYMLVGSLSFDADSNEGNFDFKKRTQGIHDGLRRGISPVSILDLKKAMLKECIRIRTIDGVKS